MEKYRYRCGVSSLDFIDYGRHYCVQIVTFLKVNVCRFDVKIYVRDEYQDIVLRVGFILRSN